MQNAKIKVLNLSAIRLEIFETMILRALSISVPSQK
jgi:hypothetical protein